MMGRQGGEQQQLFYLFSLDDHVPSDHLLRAIDRFLDLSELRRHLAPFYSHTGQPSIDPELIVRMLRLGESRQQKNIGSRGRIVRRSRSSSPISNAFFGWISYGYAVLAVPVMNSY